VLKPWTSNCEDYQLPTPVVLDDLNTLCQGMMANMPSCAINTICKNKQFAAQKYCRPFSILKEVCSDMGMNGCQDYMCMCMQNTTVVKECNTPVLPLPDSALAVKYIDQICMSMPMPDCDRCPTPRNLAKCDVLPVYSDLCKSMPTMEQCSLWTEICALVPNWPICSEGSDKPLMKMFFHWGIFDYVLIEKWVPNDTLAFIGTWLAVFAMAILYEGVRVFRFKCEQNWQPKYPESLSLNSEKSEQLELQPKLRRITPPFRFGVDVPGALLHTLEVALSFILMLVAMTFNVALFLAICGGAFVGYLCCHRFTSYSFEEASCH